jgi:hypothetical protein
MGVQDPRKDPERTEGRDDDGMKASTDEKGSQEEGDLLQPAQHRNRNHVNTKTNP